VSAEFLNNVQLAAPLHDMGKIRIPDAILNKPGRLTDEEYAVMKRHSAYGAEIIEKTLQVIEEEDYYNVAKNIARHHHERWDGKGYPDGLKGGEIPLEARIMALADVYDALLSKRVYKEAFSKEKACEILREGAGTQFDPDLTRLFLKSLGER
jgi:HD-GYP domain-containing protein (c-di-GMP phosphodiesterase class II)